MKIHREGKATLSIALIIIFLINAVVLFFQNNTIVAIVVFVVSAVVYGILLNFFRETNPVYEGEQHGVINCPTDGKVVVVEKVFENKFFNREVMQVSIFMNPFNEHCNWMPVTGKILQAEHVSGNYHAAYLPKSSNENERSEILIETPEHGTILTKQIAGALARRIVIYVREGEELPVGAPLGFIKLGSRMDVLLPADSEILVKVGDIVRGNKTVLGHLTKKNMHESAKA
jgi:phosphatidylserine decarboxylase